MIQAIPMSAHTHDYLSTANLANRDLGPAGPRKGLITNEAIVKSALSMSNNNNNSNTNTKPQRNPRKPLSDTPTGPKKDSRRLKQRSINVPDNYSNSNPNSPSKTASSKKPSSRPKSKDSSDGDSSSLRGPKPASSSVSLSSLNGGGAPSDSALTLKKNNKARSQQGDSSSLQQDQPSGAQTPKPSRRKKNRDELKTPDKRRENSNDDNDKDLKEILFPDLFGAKSAQPQGLNNGLMTPNSKQRSNSNNSKNNNNNNANMFSPQRSSPPTDCFAGSSFHNSPAPSALPKPSFKPKTACTLYSPPRSSDSTPFERMISNKLNSGFSSNDDNMSQSSNIALENDLKRLLNVNRD